MWTVVDMQQTYVFRKAAACPCYRSNKGYAKSKADQFALQDVITAGVSDLRRFLIFAEYGIEYSRVRRGIRKINEFFVHHLFDGYMACVGKRM